MTLFLSLGLGLLWDMLSISQKYMSTSTWQLILPESDFQKSEQPFMQKNLQRKEKNTREVRSAPVFVWYWSLRTCREESTSTDGRASHQGRDRWLTLPFFASGSARNTTKISRYSYSYVGPIYMYVDMSVLFSGIRPHVAKYFLWLGCL